jgi:carboxypeptidase PM20D1
MITLLIICLIRAALFKPKKEAKPEIEKVEIDSEKAVHDLQALIQCRTVSNIDKGKEDQKEFDKLEATLKSNYPHVFEKAAFTKLSPREFMFHLTGKSTDKQHASVFMAHFDVVDVNEDRWEEKPFAGVRKNGELWGRGTIDTKGTLNGTLCAADQLLAKGFVPANDMYFCFAGDEEISGCSAKLAVQYFVEHKLEPIIVIDEGGAVVNGVFPGVSRPTAVIGTAEKGAVAIEFHLDGEGGHASAPKPHTPVGKLADLAVSMEQDTFKFRITPPVKGMFDTLGREAPFKYRIIFANTWLFKPLLDKMTKKSGGQLNALCRTTCALTMMQGSSATNVIPSEAMIGANLRLLPGETYEEVDTKYKAMVAKKGLKVRIAYPYRWNPSKVSTTDCEGYEKLKKAIIGAWGEEVIVSPFLMTACADARHWSEISDKVYRFSAMKLRPEQLEMIHGDNERLTEKQIAETVEFYYRLEKSL